MRFRFWLIACILVAGIGGTARAQDSDGDSQLRYIEEIEQRNADYGPGCNGVGVSLPPAVEMPADITSDWAAAHSACIPGMRLVMTCLGEVVDADQIIGCTIQVADGEVDAPASCDRFTLIAPNDRIAPDPELSDVLSAGSEAVSRPCAETERFASGATIALAFLLPADEPATEAVVLIDVDGSEVPAFVIPAGQLGIAEISGS